MYKAMSGQLTYRALDLRGMYKCPHAYRGTPQKLRSPGKRRQQKLLLREIYLWGIAKVQRLGIPPEYMHSAARKRHEAMSVAKSN